MIREVDLVSYLPEFLREYIELKKILDVQQPEVQLLEDLTEKLKDNQFILFADTQGIEKFEQMLKIQALDDDTLENRRFRIMSRWNNNSSTYDLVWAKRKFYINNTTPNRVITFEPCYYRAFAAGSSYKLANGTCIPLRIYGIKG